jgi:large subunit ribosomal protein L31e
MMVEEIKETKVEKKAVKKLDDVKDTPENKAAIAEAEGKIVEPEKKVEAKPVAAKVEKPKKKKGEVVELEREYVVPLRRGFLNVPQYRRAKKAVKTLKEFMVRHMGVRDRDLNKVKVDISLNNEIWFRGIKKPMSKVKVKARKVGGIVYVELAEDPAVVKFAKAREVKRAASVTKTKKPKKVEEEKESDADKDGVDDKKEEAEDVKSGAEKAAKAEKAAAKIERHTAQGKHLKKTMPVRKALKK